MHFNYVMVGSAAHPDGVDRLILTSKSGGAPTLRRPWPRHRGPGQRRVPADEAAAPDVEPPSSPKMAAGNSSNERRGPSAPTPDGQQQVKTPEAVAARVATTAVAPAATDSNSRGSSRVRPPPNERPRIADLRLRFRRSQNLIFGLADGVRHDCLRIKLNLKGTRRGRGLDAEG